MPEQLICPRCGAANPVGSEVCSNCGWSPAPVQQPQSQQPGGQSYGYGQSPRAAFSDRSYDTPDRRRRLFLIIPLGLAVLLVAGLAITFIPKILNQHKTGPAGPPPATKTSAPAKPTSSPTPSVKPSSAPPSSAAPPDYNKLGAKVSSGILKIVASGCSDSGSRVGSAFLINKTTAVAALSSLAGAKVIGLSDGDTTVPATVSAADPAHGVVVLKLGGSVSGHIFKLDDKTYQAGDPVGTYGVAVKGSKPELTQSKINKTGASAVIAGINVSGLGDTQSTADAGVSGAPTLTADGDADGMVVLDSSGDMLIVSGKTVSAAVKKDGGSLPDAKCSQPLGPEATVVSGGSGKKVTTTLKSYFAGINSGDYSHAYGQLSRRDQAAGIQAYQSGWSTSYDFNINVHEATSSSAYVTFDSIFEKGKGPKGSDTCARWDIDYKFVTEGGKPVIDKATAHSGSIWKKC